MWRKGLFLLVCFFVIGSDWEEKPKVLAADSGNATKSKTSSPKKIFKNLGRLIIKFSKETPRPLKEKFFDSAKVRVLKYNIFGFDVGEFSNPPRGNIKKAFEDFLTKQKIDRRKNYKVLEYEFEKSNLKMLKPKSGCQIKRKRSGKFFPHWFDRLLGIEKAHHFLEYKEARLSPNGVVVADDGPDFDHPDIKEALKLDQKNQPYLWIRANRQPRAFVSGHGTHVGCLAAGKRDGSGIEGVAAPSSYLLPLILYFGRQENYIAFSSDIAIGLANFCELENQGKITFRVVNMSFHLWGNSKILYHAMRALVNKLFVVAAGNDKENLDRDAVPLASWRLPNKITVAATADLKDNLANFSGYGLKTVEIAAPGINVNSCKLGGGYAQHDGTSMAVPLVSGALSLLFSMEPRLTAIEAKDILISSADSLPGLKSKIKDGRRLNVYRAVRKLYDNLALKSNF